MTKTEKPEEPFVQLCGYGPECDVNSPAFRREQTPMPMMTEYEKFVAEGRGGLKEWKAWNRRIAREHW